MKKILTSILLLAMALTLQSCLHDDNELFDTPAAKRIQDVVASHIQLLESATNGWELHYYSGEDYSGGGYTMLIRFKDGKAHVSSDLTCNTSMVSTSSYDVIKDMGPVLTFNTYNELMHFLAQPYQSDVEGEQGDFEFLILEASADKIKLKGKKWKNVMEMTRIPDDVVWKDYLDKLQAVNQKLRFIYDNKINGEDVSTLYLNKDNRRVTLLGENKPESAYYVTTKGIHLYEPIDIGNGTKIAELELDETTGALVAPGEPSLTITLSENPNYNLDISTLFGSWQMPCTVYSATDQSSKTLTVDFEAIKNEIDTPYETIIEATIHYGALDYNFYLYYMPDEGELRIGNNNVKDPTDEHSYLTVYPLTDDFYIASKMSFKYNADTNKLVCSQPGYTISYLFIETDENGDEGLALDIAFTGIKTLTKNN